jgi:ankyrin repeat protein
LHQRSSTGREALELKQGLEPEQIRDLEEDLDLCMLDAGSEALEHEQALELDETFELDQVLGRMLNARNAHATEYPLHTLNARNACATEYPLHTTAVTGDIHSARVYVHYFVHILGDLQNLGERRSPVLAHDVNQKNAEGFTALHLAAIHGQAAFVRYLLNECKVDPSLPGPRLATALHLAAMDGELDTVRELVRHGRCGVDEGLADGCTAVWLAARHGHNSTMQYLVEEGKASVALASVTKDTPLHVAARYGHYHVLWSLLKKYHADCNARNNSGHTPLHEIVMRGGVTTMGKVLATHHNADVEVVDNDDMTVLDLAILNGNHQMAFMLVSKGGADLNRRSMVNRHTPLTSAARHGHTNIVIWLVESCGVDPNETPPNGLSPLQHAVISRDVIMVRFLITEGGAYVDQRDIHGDTALHTATTTLEPHMAMIRCLVGSCDADVNSRNTRGFMPIHNAALLGRNELVQYLARQSDTIINAEVVIDGAVQTPSTLLYQQKCPETAAWLERVCGYCGRRGKKRCSQCGETRYCSRLCQAADWRDGHKLACSRNLRKQMEQMAHDAEVD